MSLGINSNSPNNLTEIIHHPLNQHCNLYMSVWLSWNYFHRNLLTVRSWVRMGKKRNLYETWKPQGMQQAYFLKVLVFSCSDGLRFYNLERVLNCLCSLPSASSSSCQRQTPMTTNGSGAPPDTGCGTTELDSIPAPFPPPHTLLPFLCYMS